ncbi:PREDICTED: Copia [Prunus dulcis]|uniref:PREDICTED: Copia n=1 Tax=Prunus dulcis TaxID=3755 RepID=A0A5E4F830_PRUDU|nr:PREDICTED: Copia [Prunus dulcis]
MNAVLRILRYLKSAPRKGLMFSKYGHLNIDGYSYADWAAIAHNPVQHDRTKHVEVDQHFIKQKLEAKVFRFPFVKSEDQLADILTKAISSKAFHNSLDQLGIGDIYAPT